MSESIQIPLKSHSYFKSIFNKCDKDRDGFITAKELADLIETREYDEDIPPHIIQQIHEMHDFNKDRRLDFDEFYKMISNPKLQNVFGHYMTRYINFIIPRRHIPSTTVTDGVYEDEYSCYPPAVGMILISLVEILIYCIDEALASNSSKTASGPAARQLIYEPSRRREIWRYITYMFVHVGVVHLLLNLLVQILLGIPLEMVHKWWRVIVVYIAGVLAGSLGTSVFDPTVKLAGASGGVYSLLTAHVASIIMNWKEMSYPLAQLVVFVGIAFADVSTVIYNRYVLDIDEHIGYAAHFAGSVAGLLVGMNVLRNLSVTRIERFIWWFSIVTYGLLMAICIIWNLVWTDYFPKEMI